MKFNIETFLAISDPITKSIWEYFKTHAYNILRRPIVATIADMFIFFTVMYIYHGLLVVSIICTGYIIESSKIIHWFVLDVKRNYK